MTDLVPDYARIGDVFVRSLLARRIVRPDPLNLGLDVTAGCALRNQYGHIATQIPVRTLSP